MACMHRALSRLISQANANVPRRPEDRSDVETVLVALFHSHATARNVPVSEKLNSFVSYSCAP